MERKILGTRTLANGNLTRSNRNVDAHAKDVLSTVIVIEDIMVGFKKHWGFENRI